MKKLIILLFVNSLLISCSSSEDNNDSDIITGNELQLTHYILNYPSGNEVQHNFDGSKGVNTTRNGIQTVKFDYSNDMLTKYTRFYETGEVEEAYSFNYDATGKLTSIDETHDSFFIPANFTRTLTYSGNSIKTTYPKDNSSNYDEEFIFNNDNLLSEYVRLRPDGSLDSKMVFSYDLNENCTMLVVTGTTSSDDEYTLTYKHIFDNKPNPLYNHFKDNYLQSIFIYTRSFLFEYQIRPIIRTFGKNNMIETIFPDGTPDEAKFTYEFEYNSDGYPIEALTKNVASGQITVDNTFFYSE